MRVKAGYRSGYSLMWNWNINLLFADGQTGLVRRVQKWNFNNHWRASSWTLHYQHLLTVLFNKFPIDAVDLGEVRYNHIWLKKKSTTWSDFWVSSETAAICVLIYHHHAKHYINLLLIKLKYQGPKVKVKLCVVFNNMQHVLGQGYKISPFSIQTNDWMKSKAYKEQNTTYTTAENQLSCASYGGITLRNSDHKATDVRDCSCCRQHSCFHSNSFIDAQGGGVGWLKW